ncbi:MAG: UDP-N-acetylglucosamine diphosphorylase [Opitutales bacterium]|nr:UDP-N-acetylglucosamine diphosphorylase [Opitutales bacterium]
MKACELFTFPESLKIFSEFFDPNAQPWEWLPKIKEALNAADFAALKDAKDPSEIPQNLHIEGKVFIHKTAKLPHFGTIIGPAYIGANTELRPSVYIRGNVIAGENCVLGNSCEFKNCVLMDNAQIPHFNYVGDSILGNFSHLGAGVICANLKLDKSNVYAYTESGKVQTNLRKFGAILADKAECGCNAVLQPGTILGKKAIVLSGIAFSGYLEENTMYYEKPANPRKVRRMW